MESSSNMSENTNSKVVVVKCNTPIKKINSQISKEKLEGLRRNLLESNISYISNIHKHASTGFSDPIVLQRAASTSSLPSNDNDGNILKTQYTRKVPIIETGLNNVKFLGFANLSQTSKLTNGTQAEKVTENSSTDENLNTDVVIDLINKKYGDFLETQIPLFQQTKTLEKSTVPILVEIDENTDKENKTLHGCSPTLPTNLFQYRAREENFLEELNKEQNTNDDIIKAKKYLESIIILDSPEKNDELFTRDELKKLPDKIFNSPIHPEIKHENCSPKRENLEEYYYNGNVDTQFQNLEIIETKCEDNIIPATSFDVSVQETTSELDSSVNNDGKLNIHDSINRESKKVCDSSPKDANLDPLVDKTNLNSGNCENSYTEESLNDSVDVGGNIKEIKISDEDVIIFEEMDKFMEEIKDENKSLTCTNPKDEILLNFYEEIKEDLSDLILENNENHDYVNKSHLTNINGEESIIVSEDGNNSEKIENIENIEKCDKEKIVRNTETDKNETNKTEEQSVDSFIQEKIMNTHKSKIITVDIPEGNEMEISKGINKMGEFTEISMVEEEMSPLLLENESIAENNTSGEPVAISKENIHSTDNVIVINHDQTQEQKDVAAVFQNTCKEIDFSQCSILIVKEDGTLEPISVDKDTEPYVYFNKHSFSKIEKKDVERGDLNNEKKTIKGEQVVKTEILTLLESKKAIEWKLLDHLDYGTKIETEKLKLFSGILKEHVQLFRKMYENLEFIIESAEEELEKNMKQEDISTLLNSLVFVKYIAEKCFNKEEMKKPKYKVIRITKKNDQVKTNSPKRKSIRKKIYGKRTEQPIRLNKKLLNNTLNRMNKLLDAFEMNQKLVINPRLNRFANKQKEAGKRHKKVKKTSENAARHDKEITAEVSIQQPRNKKHNLRSEVSQHDEDKILERTKTSDSSTEDSLTSENNEKVLEIVLGNLDNTLSNETESVDLNNQEIVPQQDLSSLSSKNPETGVSKMFATSKTVNGSTKKSEKATIPQENDDNYKQNRRISKRNGNKENAKMKQKCSPRYSLRTRNSGFSSGLYQSKKYSEISDESINDIEDYLGYEVNYLNVVDSKKNQNRKLDYVLENDNTPCVVLYHKNQKQDTTLTNIAKTPLRKQNRSRNVQDDESRDEMVSKKYETRSTEMKKKRCAGEKVLRNRKI